MKKFLSLFLCTLVFGLILGSISKSYAIFIAPDDAKRQKIDQLMGEAKETITPEMLENFKKGDIYTQNMLCYKKCESYEKQLNKFMNNIALKEPKYAKLKDLKKEISDILFGMNEDHRDTNRALTLSDEAIAIKKDMSIFHYYKSVAYFLNEDWTNAIVELGKIEKKERSYISDDFYQLLGYSKMKNGDYKGALDAVTEGVKVFPSRNVYEIKMELDEKLGNKQDYLEDKKIVLFFMAVEGFDE